MHLLSAAAAAAGNAAAAAVFLHRMQLLRVLCDYCEADQKLQQLQQDNT
jgi:hypothetical protein